MQKPFDPRELLLRVRVLLATRHRVRRLASRALDGYAAAGCGRSVNRDPWVRHSPATTGWAGSSRPLSTPTPARRRGSPQAPVHWVKELRLSPPERSRPAELECDRQHSPLCSVDPQHQYHAANLQRCEPRLAAGGRPDEVARANPRLRGFTFTSSSSRGSAQPSDGSEQV